MKTDIEELKRLAEAVIKAGKTGTYKEFAIARTAFGSAANPAAVLELIAGVERVTKQRDELLAALKIFMETADRPPEADCSCHISPPCSDCVENFGLREAFSFADAAIAKAEG